MALRPRIIRRGHGPNILFRWCPSCGHRNPHNVKFCRLCGTLLEVKNISDDEFKTPQKATKRCDKCGEWSDVRQMKRVKITSKHKGVSFSLYCLKCCRGVKHGKTSRHN